MFWWLVDVDCWRIDAFALAVGACVAIEKDIIPSLCTFPELDLRQRRDAKNKKIQGHNEYPRAQSTHDIAHTGKLSCLRPGTFTVLTRSIARLGGLFDGFRFTQPILRFGVPTLEHCRNTQVLVYRGPMNSHRHDFVLRALRCRCALQARIPVERRRDLAAIHQRDDEVSRGEFHRARFQVADFKLQSTHSKRSTGSRDSAASGE